VSLTILDVLENAQLNIHANNEIQIEMGKLQLDNALTEINDNDKGLYDEYEGPK